MGSDNSRFGCVLQYIYLACIKSFINFEVEMYLKSIYIKIMTITANYNSIFKIH